MRLYCWRVGGAVYFGPHDDRCVECGGEPETHPELTDAQCGEWVKTGGVKNLPVGSPCDLPMGHEGEHQTVEPQPQKRSDSQ